MSATVRPLRRRTKRSFASKVRTFWIVLLLLSVCSAAVLFEALRWPGFQPQFIDVTGTSIVDHNDVLDKAAIDHHRNVWLLDRKAAQARIETLPYVQSARIAIVPPAHVTIAIVEREPFGCVIAKSGERMLIDRERRVLEPDCGRAQQPMFHLRSLTAVPASGTFITLGALDAMMRAQAVLAEKGAVYSLYDTDTFGELLALRSDGILVKFGSESGLAKKQRLVEPILNTIRGRLGNVRAVDVRSPATPVVEYR